MSTNGNIGGNIGGNQLQPVFSHVLTVVGGRVISSRPVELTNHPGYFRQNHFSSSLQLSAVDPAQNIDYLSQAIQDMDIEQNLEQN